MKLCKPNLPDNKVSHAIISGEYVNLIDEINKLGIKVIKTNQHNALPKAESYHADLQCIHIDNEIVVSKNNTPLIQQLEEYNINYTECINNLAANYPNCIRLCSALLDKFVLCNIKGTDKKVIELCEKNNKVILNVNQGYAKCSTAIVSDNSIITSDESIYITARKHNIDVLKIQKGFIDLPGYNYGFIGGCCGKLSKDILAFTGKIENHPDYYNIRSFCKNYSVSILSLSNKRLLDIGGILPIAESN